MKIHHRNTRRRLLAPILFSAAVAFGCNNGFAEDVKFHADQLYAESVSYSAQQDSFFVSSVKHGTVSRISPDGAYHLFINDKRLISTLGLLVDDKRNTLWVTNSDPGAGERSASATRGQLAAIATYDATSGAPKDYFDLSSLDPGAHLANDLVLDNEGNAYVTDSFSPIIYRIGADGKASILVDNPIFGTGKGFNLNGIVWLDSGFLVVGNWNTGELFRVNIKHPGDIVRVKLDAPLKGADGFHLADSGHIFVAQNSGVDMTTELASNDGWKSASVVRRKKSELSMPTAVVERHGVIFVLNSRIDTLFDSTAPKVSDFLLQQFQ